MSSRGSNFSLPARLFCWGNSQLRSPFLHPILDQNKEAYFIETGELTVTDRACLVTLEQPSAMYLAEVKSLTFTRRERHVKHPLRVRRCFVVGGPADVMGMSDVACGGGGE